MCKKSHLAHDMILGGRENFSLNDKTSLYITYITYVIFNVMDIAAQEEDTWKWKVEFTKEYEAVLVCISVAATDIMTNDN